MIYTVENSCGFSLKAIGGRINLAAVLRGSGLPRCAGELIETPGPGLIVTHTVVAVSLTC
jgi:hypothetical protein